MHVTWVTATASVAVALLVRRALRPPCRRHPHVCVSLAVVVEVVDRYLGKLKMLDIHGMIKCDQVLGPVLSRGCLMQSAPEYKKGHFRQGVPEWVDGWVSR